MRQADNKNVIEFYNQVVKLPNMPKSNDLTNKDLIVLKNTYCFAKWMLANKYNECVNSIKKYLH